MRDNREHVEPTANHILSLIRNTGRVTIDELHNKLNEEGTYTNVSKPTLRRYIYALCKTGHLQKSGIHKHTYTVIKDEPFTYIPIGCKKTKRTV